MDREEMIEIISDEITMATKNQLEMILVLLFVEEE